MTAGVPTPPEPEAIEVPPWRPDHGPRPSVQTWGRGKAPALEVRVRGEWRFAPVLAVQHYRDGRRAVQVSIHLDNPTSAQLRTYRLDPAVMRIVVAGDPPLEA
ncbi:hypothetical protein [Streptomyces sp. NPDC093589]|uniref:hypothetical protein n=1 Tax=Streptomyces sp. NPDC093589 TaxID=3366043 RepID=UPI003804D0AB